MMVIRTLMAKAVFAHPCLEHVLDFYVCNVAFIRRGVCVSLVGGGMQR